MQLRTYQKEGIDFLQRKKAILADEQGLGKTIQALCSAVLFINFTERTYFAIPVCYIVCPKILIPNWRNEIDKNFPEHSKSFIILNYEKTAKLAPETNYMLIADEAHYLKNRKAQRTKAFKKLADKADKVILLTGTPVTSYPRDLFSLLNILDFGGVYAKNYFIFAKKFCNARFEPLRVKGGRVINVLKDDGLSNVDELKELLKPIMLRRLKKDVLGEIPEMTIINQTIEGKIGKEEKALIESISGKTLEEIQSDDNVFRQLHIINIEKVAYHIEMIQNEIDNGSKIVVFARHTAVVEALVNHFNCLSIVSGMHESEINTVVSEFQENDSVKLIICSMVANIGLTLTSADLVYMCEFSLTPSQNSQAIARVHRFGQDKKTRAIFAIKTGLEEKLYKLVEFKEKQINEII